MIIQNSSKYYVLLGYTINRMYSSRIINKLDKYRILVKSTLFSNIDYQVSSLLNRLYYYDSKLLSTNFECTNLVFHTMSIFCHLSTSYKFGTIDLSKNMQCKHLS